MCSCFMGRCRHCLLYYRPSRYYRVPPPHDTSPFSGRSGKIVRAVAGQSTRAERIGGNRPQFSQRTQPIRKIWPSRHGLGGSDRLVGQVCHGGSIYTGRLRLRGEQRPGNSSRVGALPVPLGLVIPSQGFDADFVLRLPGCSRMDLPPCQKGLPPV